MFVLNTPSKRCTCRWTYSCVFDKIVLSYFSKTNNARLLYWTQSVSVKEIQILLKKKMSVCIVMSLEIQVSKKNLKRQK